MRASLSRWSLWVLAIWCLSLGAATGCKSGFSMPGTSWLSWGKKPAPTTLSSSSFPQKPSASAVPTGSPNAVAGYPSTARSGAAFGSPAGGASGYYTGPFGTGTQSAASPSYGGQQGTAYGTAAYNAGGYSASNAGGYGASGYQGANSGLASNGQATQQSGPYQSPYQSQTYQSQTAPTGATSYSYQTADLRNSDTNGGAANASSQWNSTGGDLTSPYGDNRGYPQSGGAYPSTGAAAPSSYPGSAAPSYGVPTTSYPSTGDLNATGLSQNGGGYRPGSTGRNGGNLPPGQAQSMNNMADQGFQASPGEAYPSTASGYGYPSTGQY